MITAEIGTRSTGIAANLRITFLVMALVPGVALTNCMRDFISGDFISGIYTLTEAVLIAVGMAVGAGSAVAAVIKF